MSSKNKKIKVIFVGTSDFATPCLKELFNHAEYEVIAVITKPDRPAGRKLKTLPSSVKIEAQKLGLNVLQPERIENAKKEIKNLDPDVGVVVSYGQIIPQDILDLPKQGFINVHASLLPKYRGASPIQAAILNGDAESGVTIIKMKKELDKGPIIAKDKEKVSSRETVESLHDRLAQLGANLLVKTLKKYVAGKITPLPQDDSKSSYVGILKKEDGKIKWQKSALEIERHIRAMSPWPGAFSYLDGQVIKIPEVEHDILKTNRHKIGELFLQDGKLAAQCGKDALIIKKIQIAGKKAMKTNDFLKGHKNFIEKRFSC